MKKILFLLFLSTLVKAQIVQPKSTITFSNINANGSMTVAGSVKTATLIDKSDVRYYGAVGDGVTNNTTAFTNAIIAANAGGFDVFVPNGTYIINNVPILSNVNIYGEGKGSILRPSNTGTTACFTASNVVDWSISDLKFYGYNTTAGSITSSTVITNSATNGINVSALCMRYTINKCLFYGFNGYGIYCSNSGSYSDPTTMGKIYGCDLRYNYCGLYVGQYCEYFSVDNCTFVENTYGVWNLGGNNKYAGSTFKYCYYGFNLDTGGNDSHGNIVGNDFNHCNTGLLVGAIANGETVSANAFFATNIIATSAVGLIFDANIFGAGTVSLTSCGDIVFSNNYATGTGTAVPTVTISGAASVKSIMNTKRGNLIWDISTDNSYAFSGGTSFNNGTSQAVTINQNGNTAGFSLNASAGNNPSMSLKVNSSSVGSWNYNGAEIYFNSTNVPVSFYANSVKALTTTSVDVQSIKKFKAPHIIGSSTAPTATVGGGAGVGATYTLTNCTDVAGKISVTTATLPNTDDTVITLTFNSAFDSAPTVILTPANKATANLAKGQEVFATTSTTQLIITSNGTALGTPVVYAWYYTIIQ